MPPTDFVQTFEPLSNVSSSLSWNE